MRYILPVTVGVLGLWGALISQIYWTLRDTWRSRTPQTRRWLPQAALATAGLLLAIPLVTGGIGSVQQFHLTPTELLAQNYANNSLPPDGRVMFHPKSNISSLFNREWSGYSGATAFDWWIEDPAGQSPQSFAQRGIAYFVIEADDWPRIQDKDQVQQFVSQLTLLRTIHAGAGQFGPDISFYRMLPPQHTANISFGDQIRLAGYDLSASSAAPGQTITFRPYWRASSQPSINYSMFVHLYAQGQTALVTQYDGSPGLATHLPSTWDDPNELIVGADAALPIPAQTPPGSYVIGIGLYNYLTGQRLPTPNGDTFEIPIQIGK